MRRMQAGILAWPFLVCVFFFSEKGFHNTFLLKRQCIAPRDIVAQETLPFPLPPLPHKSSPSLSLQLRGFPLPIVLLCLLRAIEAAGLARGQEGLYSINPKVWNRRRLSRVWNSRPAPLMAARLSLFRIRVYVSITSTFSLTMFTNFNLASGPISIAIWIVKHMINVEYFLFRYLNRPATQTVFGICLGTLCSARIKDVPTSRYQSLPAAHRNHDSISVCSFLSLSA